MAVTFTNNFKNILDKLESVLEAEYGRTLPVYKGYSIPRGATQAIQIVPSGTTLSEYNTTSELREYAIDVRYVFSEANINETALDHIFRQTERIQALIHNNTAMTLSDNTQAFNCRFDSSEFDSDEESGIYVVSWVYKCQHLGNVG